jgi:sulfopyruvate decarboxylase subunit alpha
MIKQKHEPKGSVVNRRVLDTLKQCEVNFASSVPCTLLSGILERISESREIIHIPATREEEAVGICAGAYLAGAKPVLLMQNSGLGNSLNALLSLISFYKLGLLLLIGYRGRLGEEKITAQIPIGLATPRILSLIGAESRLIEDPEDICKITELATHAYKKEKISVALLTPKLWERK